MSATPANRPSRSRKEVKHYSDDNPSTFATKKRQPIVGKRPVGRPKASPAAKSLPEPATSPDKPRRTTTKRSLRVFQPPPSIPRDTILSHAVQWSPIVDMDRSDGSSLDNNGFYRAPSAAYGANGTGSPEWTLMPTPYYYEDTLALRKAAKLLPHSIRQNLKRFFPTWINMSCSSDSYAVVDTNGCVSLYTVDAAGGLPRQTMKLPTLLNTEEHQEFIRGRMHIHHNGDMISVLNHQKNKISSLYVYRAGRLCYQLNYESEESMPSVLSPLAVSASNQSVLLIPNGNTDGIRIKGKESSILIPRASLYLIQVSSEKEESSAGKEESIWSTETQHNDVGFVPEVVPIILQGLTSPNDNAGEEGNSSEPVSPTVHAVVWDDVSVDTDKERTCVAVVSVDQQKSFLVRMFIPSGAVTQSVDLPSKYVKECNIQAMNGRLWVTTGRGIQVHDATTLQLLSTYGALVGLHGKTLSWKNCLLVPAPKDGAGSVCISSAGTNVNTNLSSSSQSGATRIQSNKKQTWCQRWHGNILSQPESRPDDRRMLLVGIPLFDRGPQELWSNLYVWDLDSPLQPQHVITCPKGGLMGAIIRNGRWGWSIQCATVDHGVPWEYSPMVKSEFAGSMYPIGYQVLNDNWEFVEEEDALDVKVADATDSSEVENATQRIEKQEEESTVDVLTFLEDSLPQPSSFILDRKTLPPVEDDEEYSSQPPDSPLRLTGGSGVLSVYPQYKQQHLLVQEQALALAEADAASEIEAPKKAVTAKRKRNRPTVEAVLEAAIEPKLRHQLLQQETKWSSGRGSRIMVDSPKSDKQVIENASQEEKELALELLLLSPSKMTAELNGSSPNTVSHSQVVKDEVGGSVPSPFPTPTLRRLSSIPCAACRGRLVRHVCGKRDKPIDYAELARLEKERKQRDEAEKQRQRTAKRKAAELRRHEAKKKKLEEERLHREREEESRRQETERQQIHENQLHGFMAEKPTPIQIWNEAVAPTDSFEASSYVSRPSSPPAHNFTTTNNSSAVTESVESYLGAVPEEQPSPQHSASNMSTNESDALAALADLAGLQSSAPAPHEPHVPTKVEAIAPEIPVSGETNDGPRSDQNIQIPNQDQTLSIAAEGEGVVDGRQESNPTDKPPSGEVDTGAENPHQPDSNAMALNLLSTAIASFPMDDSGEQSCGDKHGLAGKTELSRNDVNIEVRPNPEPTALDIFASAALQAGNERQSG